MQNTLIVLIGPSGSGKTTLANEALHSGITQYIIKSVTTRPMGEREDSGEYRHISKNEFSIEDYVEYTEYDNNLYGIPKSEMDEALTYCRSIVATDIHGAQQVKKYCTDKAKVILVFLDSSNETILNRLEKRGRGNVEARMARVEKDREAAQECDIYLTNNDGYLALALNTIKSLYEMGVSSLRKVEEFQTTESIPPDKDYLGNDTLQTACDGACTINGSGGHAWFDGEEYHSKKTLSNTTNNKEEYRGLIALLKTLVDKKVDKNVVILMDSQLVVYQMNGRYAVKNEGLKPLYMEAKALESLLDVIIMWVPRSHPIMGRVDTMAKEAAR